ncbi:DUF4214 domain-containing protein [Halomonas sp. PR-M31]|uniref:DUF4214 domain-containing protein n=1 Tax=Halomonas sp. PR-M31 TaxID=1471202 RepID=UPI00065142B3|nr:DUF4214 domain-containing protein [Halomonas sp. PR-M31]
MAKIDNMSFVQQLYVAYYGRPGDRDGLSYWADRVEKEGEGNIIDAFGESQEFGQRFGSFDETTLVNNLYQQIFGRDADEGGLAYYVKALTDGVKSLSEIALTISNAAQGKDVEVMESRLEIADAYTTKKAAGGFDAATAEALLKRVKSDDDDLLGSTKKALEEIEDMLEDAFDDIEDAIEDMLDELEEMQEAKEDALEDAREDEDEDEDDDNDLDDQDDVLELDDEVLTALLNSSEVSFDNLTLTGTGDDQELTADLHYGEYSFRVEIDDDTAAFAKLVGLAQSGEADAAVIA